MDAKRVGCERRRARCPTLFVWGGAKLGHAARDGAAFDAKMCVNVVMDYGGACEGGSSPGRKRRPGIIGVLHFGQAGNGFSGAGGGGGGIGFLRWRYSAALARESVLRWAG